MFSIGQQVTVIDGGWTGIIERIDPEMQAAYIRFPGRPDLPCYAFEALAGMFDTLTDDERHALHLKLCAWTCRFGEVSHALARAALAYGEYDGPLWDRRDPYKAAGNEMYALVGELAA